MQFKKTPCTNIVKKQTKKTFFKVMLVLMVDERVKHVALKTNKICDNNLSREVEQKRSNSKKNNDFVLFYKIRSNIVCY